jgi:hypothetical protein
MGNGAVRSTPGADGEYWRALEEGRLELPVCQGCGRWHWPAVWRCGDCGGWEHAWREVPMQGTIFTWTRTWHPFAGTEAIGPPFVSLVVALDDAPVRLTGLLMRSDADVRIGAAVSGSPGVTRIGDEDIPAIRWSLQG